MAITVSLENKPSTTAESVNVKPFSRTGWTQVTPTDVPANVSMTESKMLGDNPLYPLTRQVTVREAKLYHPGQKAKDAVVGRRYSVATFTTLKTEDSVSGLVQYQPVQLTVSAAIGGQIIQLPADVLNMLLSTAAELWDSVTTGTPDGVPMAKLALGATEI